MDSATAEIVQTAILAGCATIAGVTAMGLRAWQRVAHGGVELRRQAGKEQRGEAAATLDELRREIGQLRDTTTRYDMAFDTALQRLESRIVLIEAGRPTNLPDARREVARPDEAAVARNLE